MAQQIQIFKIKASKIVQTTYLKNWKEKTPKTWAPNYAFGTCRLLERSEDLLSWPPRRTARPALRAAGLQNICCYLSSHGPPSSAIPPSHPQDLRCDVQLQHLLLRCLRRVLEVLLPPSVVLAGACGHGFGLHSSGHRPHGRDGRTVHRLLHLQHNIRAYLGLRLPLHFFV